MRTRLFHAIVACGAALGAAAACSGDADDAPKEDSNDPHACPQHFVTTTGGSAPAAVTDGGAGGSDDGTSVGCGGWPPTK